MKKIAATILLASMILSATACTKERPADTTATTTTEVKTTTEETTEATEATTTTAEETTQESHDVEVYEADRIESQGEFRGEPITISYSIPAIKINGSANEDLNAEIRAVIDEYRSQDRYYGSEYVYYVGEEYVSILVNFLDLEDDDNCKYTAINISLVTYSLMSDEEFLEANGLSMDDYYSLVKSTLELVMDEREDLFNDGFEDYRAKNLEDGSIRKARPFISERGNLCFILTLDMAVGSQRYTYCIDTVTHEHANNINADNWSFFPV